MEHTYNVAIVHACAEPLVNAEIVIVILTNIIAAAIACAGAIVNTCL